MARRHTSAVIDSLHLLGRDIWPTAGLLREMIGFAAQRSMELAAGRGAGQRQASAWP
jgi:hypothetical protein